MRYPKRLQMLQNHAWPLTPLASPCAGCCSSTDFSAFIGAGLRMRAASIRPALGLSSRPKPGRSSVFTSRKPLVGMGSFRNLESQLMSLNNRLRSALTSLQTLATPTCHQGCSPGILGTASWPATQQSGTSMVHWREERRECRMQQPSQRS